MHGIQTNLWSESLLQLYNLSHPDSRLQSQLMSIRLDLKILFLLFPPPFSLFFFLPLFLFPLNNSGFRMWLLCNPDQVFALADVTGPGPPRPALGSW